MAIALSLFQSSCTKDDQMPLFEWVIESELELQANGNTFVQLGTDIPNVINTIDGQLAANNLRASDLDRLEVREVLLFSEDGSSLKFIDRISLSLYNLSEINNDVEIGFLEMLGAGTSTEIRMFPNIPSSKMTDFLMMDRLGFRLLYRVFENNSNIRARIRVNVRAF